MLIGITITLLTLLVIVGSIFFEILHLTRRFLRGQRSRQLDHSPNYVNGFFQNEEETPQMTNKSGWRKMFKTLFRKVEHLTPDQSLPVVETDLHVLTREEEIIVWLGHSTVFIQTGGKRYLFDPILKRSFPSGLMLKPFCGTDAYTPDDIPEIDYLVITHDHWDHLDRLTVSAIRERVRNVVCPLGVGQYLEDWDYPAEKVHELDWNESLAIDAETALRCLPSRHFSGRLLLRNRTLWASFLIDGSRKIFVSGDGGYDSHFARIGKEFPGIDLAIMENGQYNEHWKYIHTMPDLLPKAIDELSPRRVMTYHHSKFALSRHPWREPLDNIVAHATGKPWKLVQPRIGEVFYLDQDQEFEKWW